MGRSRVKSKLPSNIYKRGLIYYVRLWAKGRSVWRKAGSNLHAAQILLGKLREATERGELGLPKRSCPTLRAWAPKYLEWAKIHKRSWPRDEWCLRQLVEVFGDFRLLDINKTRVAAFMRDRRKDVAPATVNRQVALLRKVFSHALEAGEIEANPLRAIKLLPEPAGRMPVLELEDQERLVQACPSWLGWLVRLAIATGCREGELLALTWRHVDFGQGELIIETSKSGEPRRVPLHPVILPELRRRRGLPEASIVMLSNGQSPSRYTVADAFKQATRKIGRGELRFHDLRHVAGSRLMATGANLPEVADFLGHKTLSMARRYSHTSRSRLRTLVAGMPVGGNG